jgi:hypothetical protein
MPPLLSGTSQATQSRPVLAKRSTGARLIPDLRCAAPVGDRVRVRTCSPQLRRLMLYPVELRGRLGLR